MDFNEENILWSSVFISNFQTFFGVQKLKVDRRHKSDENWIAVRVKDKIASDSSSSMNGIHDNENCNYLHYKVS